jgi:osmotically inducible protein OsmC
LAHRDQLAGLDEVNNEEHAMIRKSVTEWQGDGPTGSGSLSTESGALRALPFSFKTRFQSEGKAGTNPEELLGAAHASCFAMTVAFMLTDAGYARTSRGSPQGARLV